MTSRPKGGRASNTTTSTETTSTATPTMSMSVSILSSPPISFSPSSVISTSTLRPRCHAPIITKLDASFAESVHHRSDGAAPPAYHFGATRYPLLSACCHVGGMAETQNDGQFQWPAKVRDLTEQITPVNAPSCYRASLVSGSLEITARLNTVHDLDLLMNVLESHRAFFLKKDRLAAEVLVLT